MTLRAIGEKKASTVEVFFSSFSPTVMSGSKKLLVYYDLIFLPNFSLEELENVNLEKNVKKVPVCLILLADPDFFLLSRKSFIALVTENIPF